MEVRVLGDGHQTLPGCEPPHYFIVGGCQSLETNMRRARIQISEDFEESGREVLIEEQSHAGGIETSRRSRSAAKAR
jgi:hypothetical protein